MNPSDNADWLLRFTPSEWVRAGLAEVEQATMAATNGDMAGAVASCKRGAGMSLNALVRLEAAGELPPRFAWGRTYVEHLQALSSDAEAPAAVRAAANGVLAAKSGPMALVALRLGAQRGGATGFAAPGHAAVTRPLVVEQAYDVIAHVYALLVRHGAYKSAPEGAASAVAMLVVATPASVSTTADAATDAVCSTMVEGRRNPTGSSP